MPHRELPTISKEMREKHGLVYCWLAQCAQLSRKWMDNTPQSHSRMTLKVNGEGKPSQCLPMGRNSGNPWKEKESDKSTPISQSLTGRQLVRNIQRTRMKYWWHRHLWGRTTQSEWSMCEDVLVPWVPSPEGTESTKALKNHTDEMTISVKPITYFPNYPSTWSIGPCKVLTTRLKNK